jgi:hypothetical protein
MDSFLRPLHSFHHFVARARVFVIPKGTTHHHDAAAKQKRKEKSQILAKKERKKETIIQTDKRERKGERKKREQSDCERAAPHPGSRVSNRYHLSVGKNQSPGALLLLLVCVSARLAILDCKHIAPVASNVVINVLFSFFLLEPPSPPLLFCSRGLVCCLDFSVEN